VSSLFCDRRLPNNGTKILLSRRRKPKEFIDQWSFAEFYFAMVGSPYKCLGKVCQNQ